jgi:thioester reductase-like protein
MMKVLLTGSTGFIGRHCALLWIGLQDSRSDFKEFYR